MGFTRLDPRGFAQPETNLPLLFVARMLALYLVWVAGMRHISPPFLSFWAPLDQLKGLAEYYFILDGLYWCALLCVLIGYRFQSFSLVVGFLIFFQITSSVSAYSTNFLFSGCLFLLIGLYKPGLEWTFRVQFGLLYLGAGLNKLLDMDWQSGQYFVNFIGKVYPNPFNRWLVDWVGLESLSQILSVLTVTIELGLAFWLFWGKSRVVLVYCILIFHLCFLIFTMGELSFIYFLLISAGSYLLLPWPDSRELSIKFIPKNIFLRLLKLMDFSHFFSWEKANFEKKSLICSGNAENKGAPLSWWLLIFHKTFFFAIVSSIVFVAKNKFYLIHLFRGN